MSITVDKTGLDKKIRKLKQLLKGAEGKKIFDKLAKMAADLIFKRTKSGYGVDNDDTDQPHKIRLKPLSNAYVKLRSKRKPTGSFAGAKKSNLTYTGQMLDNLISRGFKGGFEVQVKNSSRPDSSATNQEIAGYQREQGRMFLALTGKEQRILFREYEKMVRELARKILR